MKKTFCSVVLALPLACTAPESPDVASTKDEVGSLDDDILTQSDAGASVEAGDQFGRALATGDFNRDGYPDLAIGTPYEDDGATNCGLVVVFYGGSGGIGSGGSERFTQNSVFEQTNEASDHFGWSLAAGDFDNDTYDDLAIGVPYEDVGSISNAGMVAVMFGSSQGLLPSSSEYFTQNSVVSATNEAGDRFGYALAAGNFNGDAYMDLAVSAPYEDTDGATDTGLVAIMYGSSSGLVPSSSESITQNSVSGATNEDGDRFGFALAAGNFNGDAYSDLAIGIPYENTGGANDTGLVAIMFGSSSGLLPPSTESFTQSSVVNATNEDNDRFGYRLATGNLNGDGYDDLVIGVPFEDRGGATDSGFVAVMYGKSNGLLPSSSEAISQPTGFTADESSDRFGWSLTTADFDGDGYDDLVVGSPGEDALDWTNNGIIHAFFGSSAGVLPARAYWLRQASFGGAEEDGDQFGYTLAAADFDNDGRAELAVGAPYEDVGSTTDAGAVFVSGLEPALPGLISTQTAIVLDTNTAEVYGAKMPDERRAMASTTKIMTALLTIEALNDGDIGSNDTVVISPNAAATGGSSMGLGTWNLVSVNDLLYGLMLPSGNDAAVALAEYVGGSVATFVARMNTRASQLGLTNTSYVNPHGMDPCGTQDFGNPSCAHYSSARDLAMLARFALSDPTFATIVGTENFTTSTWTTLFGGSLDTELCNTNRLLRDGSGSCSSSGNYDANAYGVKTGTTDDAQACLVGATTQGSADVIAVVLGATRDTNDRYDDIDTIFDFAFNGP